MASVMLNLASAVVSSYGSLLALRSLAGAAAGIMVWLSWAKAMRLAGSMRTVAAAGPLTVFVAAPLIGWLAATGGTGAVFLFLAAVSLPGSLLPAEFANFRHERQRRSPSILNIALVVTMGVMTMSGSALFVYTATVAEAVGMSGSGLSMALSGNALAGFAAARITRKRGSGGLWLIVISVCAAVVGFSSTWQFVWAALVVWGFCFWMATPRILQSIADWSLAPDERVGDTQSAMATGRAVGPAIGGMLIGTGTFTGLATFTVIGLATSGLAVIVVARYRGNHDPPPRTTPV